MTDANNANCRQDGENADLEIEDLCGADETAGEMADEVLEISRREDF